MINYVKLFIMSLIFVLLVACQPKSTNSPQSAYSLNNTYEEEVISDNLSVRIDWVYIMEDFGESLGDSEVYFELYVIRENGDSRQLRAPSQDTYKLILGEKINLDQFSLTINNLQEDEEIFVYLLALEADELSSNTNGALDIAMNASSIMLEEGLASGEIASLISKKASILTFILASVSGVALEWWQQADVLGEYSIL